MNSADGKTPARQVADAAMLPGAIGANEPEEQLWQGGYSPKAMFGTWLLSALVTIGLVVGMFLVPPESVASIGGTRVVWQAGLAIILIWWVLAIASYLYRRISVRYELTTQRFIHKHGILTRTTDRIELIDIDDVAFSQGLVQRMLGVGTIKLTSSDRSHPLLNLMGIDEVNRVSGMIDDARRKERRRRSLHIEAS